MTAVCQYREVYTIDSYQTAAARHFRGPMLVLAGPGSGKTTVITQRVRILLEEYRVSPGNILVITFTRAAAQEMKQRFLALTQPDPMGSEPARVSFGTFHSVFFTILKTAYGYTPDSILREDVRYQFFRDYIHTHSVDTEDEQEFIRSVISEISLLKNQSIPIEHYYSTVCGADVFRDIFRAYQRFLRENRRIDFDDMLTQTLDLFLKSPGHLKAWQQKFPFILIDEFQDINQIQYKIVRMLAAPRSNLFVVGDDDQSIYRFRGADPKIMLDFQKDYPDAQIVYLPVNYRSAPGILQAAQNLIRHNQVRYQKESLTAREPDKAPAAADGKPAVCEKTFTERRLQNLFIVGEIRQLLKDGVQPSEIAVLARTNAGLDELAELLSSYNIVWQSKERVPSLYDHWITKDIFTYIHIARGEMTRANFLRIMNRPNRYLSRELLPRERADANGRAVIDFDAWRARYRTQPWVAARLNKLREDLGVIAAMRPYSAVNYIRRAAAYDDYVKDQAASRNIPAEDLLEVLDALLERAKGYETVDAWEEQIARLEAENRSRFQRTKEQADAVALSTFHGAKGLEYRAVFLPDLCEGICPYKKAVLDADIEEERRMLYVAMTRAKERLYLLSVHRIHNKDMLPSGFLGEIRHAPHT